MSIQCTQVQAELPLFVGGDLESPGRERVAEHLASCDSCRSDLARAGQARAVLTRQFETTAELQSSSVWPDVRERLRAEGLILGTPEHPAAPLAPAGRLLRLASFGAAAAGLLLLGSLAGQWYSQPGADLNQAGPNGLAERQQATHASALTSGQASEILPVDRSHGLREMRPGESFSTDSRLFQSQPPQPFNAFAADGLRTVGNPGAGHVVPVRYRVR